MIMAIIGKPVKIKSNFARTLFDNLMRSKTGYLRLNIIEQKSHITSRIYGEIGDHRHLIKFKIKYSSFTPNQKVVAKHIFLALTNRVQEVVFLPAHRETEADLQVDITIEEIEALIQRTLYYAIISCEPDRMTLQNRIYHFNDHIEVCDVHSIQSKHFNKKPKFEYLNKYCQYCDNFRRVPGKEFACLTPDNCPIK